jgi:hypothetical protein
MTRREIEREARDRVREAFDALLSQGVRPTGDRIVAWLQANRGKAGSLRDLHPAFAELRDERMQAAAVARIVERYRQLDVLQREAARILFDAVDRGERDDEPERKRTPGPAGGMQELDTEGTAA